MVASKLTWRADKVLCSSYILDIYSDDVGLFILVPDLLLVVKQEQRKTLDEIVLST